MEIIIILALLTFLFWLGFIITGTLLSTAMWIMVKLPLAIIVFVIGVLCCLTLLLIPVGLKCFKLALRIVL